MSRGGTGERKWWRERQPPDAALISREKFLHVIMQTIRIICKKRICEGAQTEVRMTDKDSCQTHVEQGNDQNRKEIPGKGSSCFHFVLQNCCKFGRSRSQKLAKRGGGRNSAKMNRMITAAFVSDVLPSWKYQNVRLKTSFFLNSGRRECVGYAISISDRCKPEVGERARKVW